MKYIRLHNYFLNEDYVSSYDDETENDYENMDNVIENNINEILKNKTPFFIALFNHCNSVHYPYSRMMAFRNIVKLLSGKKYQEEISHIMDSTYEVEYASKVDPDPDSFYEIIPNSDNAISEDVYKVIVDFYKNNYDIIQFLIFCRGFVKAGTSASPIETDSTWINFLGFWQYGLNTIYASTTNVYTHKIATKHSVFNLIGNSDMYKNILNGFKNDKAFSGNEYADDNICRLYKLDILFDDKIDFSPFGWYKNTAEIKYPKGFPVSTVSGGTYNLNFVYYSTLSSADMNEYSYLSTSLGVNGEIKKKSQVTLQNQFNEAVKEFKQNTALKSEFMKIENALNQQLTQADILNGQVSVHVYLYCGPSKCYPTDKIEERLQKWYNVSYFCEQIF